MLASNDFGSHQVADVYNNGYNGNIDFYESIALSPQNLFCQISTESSWFYANPY